MAQVQFDGVRKVYENGIVAVHGATFEVGEGEFVVLVGPSGCGKSTMLRLIAGLESATGGTISIGGRTVNQVSPKDRDVAMVFQNYALYPHLSVFDNMAFGLKLRKYPKADIRARVERAAAVLGLAGVLDRRPKQLSGGQRQRVALGRAIVRKPQAFLFDEPLASLDAQLRVQMRTEIARLHQRLGATTIYVTHDQTEAMTMGDRIVVLEGGHVQQIGAPLALYGRPANRFVAGFIGSLSMNFVEGRLVGGSDLRFEAASGAFTLPLGTRPALGNYVGRGVTLGVRPEDLYAAGSAPAPQTSAEVDVALDVVEPMGSETVVYGRAGAHTLVARLAPHTLPAPGETIRLALDPTRLYFFDAETEAALGAPAGEAGVETAAHA